MKKKHLWLLAGGAAAAVLVILAVLFFPKEETPSEDAPFLIGQLLYSTTDPFHTSFSVSRKTVVEAGGGQLVTAEMSDTPESIISGVEDLIGMGCKGIILTPVSNAILPQIRQLCDDAQVYWIVSMRPIHDAGMFQMLASSPYFLGTVSEDDAAAAETMVQELANQGVDTVVTYSISNINATIEARELGVKQACAANGIEILEEVVNIKEPDMLAESVRELLALHPDLDAIISLSNSATGQGMPILETLLQSGVPVKYASFDTSSQWSDYFDQGVIVTAANGNSTIDAVVATSLLVNAVGGNPVSDTALQITLPYTMVSSSDQLLRLKDLAENTFLSAKNIDRLLQEDVTLEDYDAYQASCLAQIP